LCDPDEKKAKDEHKVVEEKIDAVEEETDGDQKGKTKQEDPVADTRTEDPDATR